MGATEVALSIAKNLRSEHAYGASDPSFRTHVMPNFSVLSYLSGSVDHDGFITRSMRFHNGMLLPGDKLLFEGPLHGANDCKDISLLKPPVELAFELRAPPKLELRSTRPSAHGPYGEV